MDNREVNTQPEVNSGPGPLPGKRRISSFIRRIKTFESLGNPGYRIFFLSNVAGMWGAMGMAGFAQQLLIFRLTESTTILGLMSMVNAIPNLLLSLFGGVVADRIPKKMLLIIGQAATTIATLVITIVLATGYLSSAHPGSWWLIIAAGVFQSIFTSLTYPAQQSIIPELVNKRQIVNAMSLWVIGINATGLIVTAAAGFLVNAIDFLGLYYIITGLNIISVIILLFLPVKGKISLSGSNAIVDLKEGLNYAISERAIMLVIIIMFVAVIFSVPVQTLLPAIADNVLRVGASGLGILMAVNSAGAFVASFILASLRSRKRGLALVLSGLVWSLGIIIFAFSKSWPLSLVLIFVFGSSRIVNQIASTTLLQSLSESKYLGRVMSLQSIGMGLMGLAGFAAGALAQRFGVSAITAAFALIFAVISVFYLFIPRMRKLD